MIYEFALDPELVARWYDPMEWAFFRDAFGWETGRVGAVYPQKWDRQVIKAFLAHTHADKDSSAFRRLEARLSDLMSRAVKRESTFAELPNWLEKAEAECGERPFRGILSLSNPRGRPEVMTPDDLFSERPPPEWRIPPNPVPPRNAQELAEAVTPLLRCCRQCVFVDPHLNPIEPRYANVLKALLGVLDDSRCIVRNHKLDIFVGEGKVGGAMVLRRFENWLPQCVPPGMRVTVTVLRERPSREKLHNRYLLTDRGGVIFGVGLDEEDEAGHGQTDDLCRLSSEQWTKRWGDYVSARESTFCIAAGPAEIASRSG